MRLTTQVASAKPAVVTRQRGNDLVNVAFTIVSGSLTRAIILTYDASSPSGQQDWLGSTLRASAVGQLKTADTRWLQRW